MDFLIFVSILAFIGVNLLIQPAHASSPFLPLGCTSSVKVETLRYQDINSISSNTFPEICFGRCSTLGYAYGLFGYGNKCFCTYISPGIDLNDYSLCGNLGGLSSCDFNPTFCRPRKQNAYLIASLIGSESKPVPLTDLILGSISRENNQFGWSKPEQADCGLSSCVAVSNVTSQNITECKSMMDDLAINYIRFVNRTSTFCTGYRCPQASFDYCPPSLTNSVTSQRRSLSMVAYKTWSNDQLSTVLVKTSADTTCNPTNVMNLAQPYAGDFSIFYTSVDSEVTTRIEEQNSVFDDDLITLVCTGECEAEYSWGIQGSFGFELSVMAGGKAGVPLVAEGSIEVTATVSVGVNWGHNERVMVTLKNQTADIKYLKLKRYTQTKKTYTIDGFAVLMNHACTSVVLPLGYFMTPSSKYLTVSDLKVEDIKSYVVITNPYNPLRRSKASTINLKGGYNRVLASEKSKVPIVLGSKLHED